MEFIELQATLKEGKGKELNKKLRESGLVPAIVYKRGEESVSIKIDRKSLVKALRSEAGENAIIKLYVDGAKKKKTRTVMIKEIQKDPVKDNILHVDFHEISLTDTLKVKVPIAGKGEPVGVKQDGGILQHILWEVEVECLPTNIPEKIEVAVNELKIGEAMHVKDIRPPEGVKILADPEAVIFSVEHPKAVEEIVAEAEAAAGAAEEPEVIKEKKEKPEEEAPEEAAGKPAEEKKEKKEEKKD